MKNIITAIITIVMPFVLNAQDNTFIGPGTDWDTPSNWSTNKVPPTDITQKITISSNCEVNNANNYKFFKGSVFRINSGITFTNSGSGTWIMEGIMENEGEYEGNLVIAGNIEPGNNTSDWSCGAPIVYAGKSYNTVEIGSQCWLTQNLDVGTMVTGINEQTDNSIIEKYCYDNDPANCDIYGGLYKWNEMMQYTTIESSQGICPTGWHLPSDDEWIILEEELGMCPGTGTGCSEFRGRRGTDQACQLSGNTSLWNDGSLENNSTFGSSGMNFLPGGARLVSGIFTNKGIGADLWSSSQVQNPVSSARYRDTYFDDLRVIRWEFKKAAALSVRCVKD